MEIVQVETKGGTRLAKRSLFRLTALRSLQHNSSLSSPLLSDIISPPKSQALVISIHSTLEKPRLSHEAR